MENTLPSKPVRQIIKARLASFGRAGLQPYRKSPVNIGALATEGMHTLVHPEQNTALVIPNASRVVIQKSIAV